MGRLPEASLRRESRQLLSNSPTLEHVLATTRAVRSEDAGQLEERALVERAQRGDAHAFGTIYQRHIDRVYSFVEFRVRDRAVAEDLTQEVFLQALRGLDAFDWRGSMAPWLLRIARNAVIDHWRRRGRRPERTITSLEAEGDQDEEGFIDRLGSTGGGYHDADEPFEQLFTREHILNASLNLTELQQQVLALRFAADLSIKETSEIMGRSEGAIKNLQHHAMRALKRHLTL